MKDKNKKIMKTLAIGGMACLSVGLFAGCEKTNTENLPSSGVNCSCNHEVCDHEPCTHELCNHEKCTNQYVVYFHLNNGDGPYINFVKEGDTVDMDFFKDLIHYSKEYIKFDAWCTDAALKNEFDESTPITKNMNLYAKYNIKEGYQFYEMATGSMEASNILIGDVICYKKSLTTDTYNIGDIVVFHPTMGRYVSDNIVCHEIVEIVEEGGTVTYKTKGSSNVAEDSWVVTPENILGKALDILMRDGKFVFMEIQ